MPLAMICMALIFVCLIGYWKSESLLMVTIFAAIVGCLIYVPQFLASVQTMEIVPSFAVGSAVGLRGFMSYIFGASLGTSLFGVMVDKLGWYGGFLSSDGRYRMLHSILLPLPSRRAGTGTSAPECVTSSGLAAACGRAIND